MADARLTETQIKAGNAPQTVPEAQSTKGLQLAESLMNLLNTAGKTLPSIITSDNKAKTKTATNELLSEIGTNPKEFFKKWDTTIKTLNDTPPGWNKQKWNAYQDLKSGYVLNTFPSSLAEAEQKYINSRSDDEPFTQSGLENEYQKVFESVLKDNGGALGVRFMKSFVMKGSALVEARVTAGRNERAKTSYNNLKNESEKAFYKNVSAPDSFKNWHQQTYGVGKNNLPLPEYNFDNFYPTSVEAIGGEVQWIANQLNTHRKNIKTLTGTPENGEAALNLFKNYSQQVQAIWLDDSKTMSEKKSEADKIIKVMNGLFTFKDRDGISLGQTEGASSLQTQINNAVKWENDKDILANQEVRKNTVNNWKNLNADLYNYVQALFDSEKELDKDIAKELGIEEEDKANYAGRYEKLLDYSAKKMIDLEDKLVQARYIGDSKTVAALEKEKDKLQLFVNGTWSEQDNSIVKENLRKQMINGSITLESIYSDAEDLTLDTLTKIIEDRGAGVDDSIKTIKKGIYDLINLPDPDGFENELIIEFMGSPRGANLNKLNTIISEFYEPGKTWKDGDKSYTLYDIMNSGSIISLVQKLDPEIKELINKVINDYQAYFSVKEGVQ